MDFFKNIDSEFYNEPSFLDVSAIVKLKRSQGRYNFEQLPKMAIIVSSKKIIGRFSTSIKKKLKGLSGANYIYNSSILICSEIGTGAPAALVLMEELRALGVERFVFIGTAGILTNDISETEARIITKAHTTIGSTTFYSNKAILEPFDHEWIKDLKQQLNLVEASGWSTDCPYRETPAMLNYFKERSVHLVDMECAGIYAFSMFYRLPAICILIGADSLTQMQWRAPENMNLLTKKQRELLADLLSLQYPK